MVWGSFHNTFNSFRTLPLLSTEYLFYLLYDSLFFMSHILFPISLLLYHNCNKELWERKSNLFTLFAKKILLLWKRSLAIYIVFLLSWSILFLTAWMLLSVIIFTILIFSLSLPILIFSLSLIICLFSLSTIFIKKFFHSEPTPNAFAKFFCMMASISYRDFPLVFSLLMKPIDT